MTYPRRPGFRRGTLDQRKGSVLRAVVREYVRTGQPVASRTLAQSYSLQVSAATIRNDMGFLEDMGYIVQPHTSAGRIPTDLGYRWFVDNWPDRAWPEIPDHDRRAIDVVLDAEFRGLDYTLDSTSHVLSDLTEAAGIVVAPPSGRNVLRRIELFKRDPRRATMLLIARSGEVEQGVVELGQDRTDDELEDLAIHLTAQLEGVELEDLSSKIRTFPWLCADAATIAEQIDNLIAAGASRRIFRGGTANMLSRRYFSDIETVQEIVDALEHPVVISRLMAAVEGSGTVLVFIGHEVPIEQMRACAAIFAQYEVGADRQGTVGVIGPTRMDYPHTIAAVEAVARRLTSLLESAS